ncbi:hypothetical protein KFL_003250010 [Klebsormidium nitens]|uniref:Uncharacterized protein n=1 Tax=Klebsormidium nitens TaxID=105231 RepID=A0A1Y1IC47_KLENI|nr:hypothetical protein KFL_003250010 [Klebsormidium nitens]|eukprot:GAQ86999.1 hypothetical protein KFL_003250010 [Klebsormidium nitens]
MNLSSGQNSSSGLTNSTPIGDKDAGSGGGTKKADPRHEQRDEADKIFRSFLKAHILRHAGKNVEENELEKSLARLRKHIRIATRSKSKAQLCPQLLSDWPRETEIEDTHTNKYAGFVAAIKDNFSMPSEVTEQSLRESFLKQLNRRQGTGDVVECKCSGVDHRNPGLSQNNTTAILANRDSGAKLERGELVAGNHGGGNLGAPVGARREECPPKTSSQVPPVRYPTQPPPTGQEGTQDKGSIGERGPIEERGHEGGYGLHPLLHVPPSEDVAPQLTFGPLANTWLLGGTPSLDTAPPVVTSSEGAPIPDSSAQYSGQPPDILADYHADATWKRRFEFGSEHEEGLNEVLTSLLSPGQFPTTHLSGLEWSPGEASLQYAAQSDLPGSESGQSPQSQLTSDQTRGDGGFSASYNFDPGAGQGPQRDGPVYPESAPSETGPASSPQFRIPGPGRAPQEVTFRGVGQEPPRAAPPVNVPAQAWTLSCFREAAARSRANSPANSLDESLRRFACILVDAAKHERVRQPVRIERLFAQLDEAAELDSKPEFATLILRRTYRQWNPQTQTIEDQSRGGLAPTNGLVGVDVDNIDHVITLSLVFCKGDIETLDNLEVSLRRPDGVAKCILYSVGCGVIDALREAGPLGPSGGLSGGPGGGRTEDDGETGAGRGLQPWADGSRPESNKRRRGGEAERGENRANDTGEKGPTSRQLQVVEKGESGTASGPRGNDKLLVLKVEGENSGAFQRGSPLREPCVAEDNFPSGSVVWGRNPEGGTRISLANGVNAKAIIEGKTRMSTLLEPLGKRDIALLVAGMMNTVRKMDGLPPRTRGKAPYWFPQSLGHQYHKRTEEMLKSELLEIADSIFEYLFSTKDPARVKEVLRTMRVTIDGWWSRLKRVTLVEEALTALTIEPQWGPGIGSIQMEEGELPGRNETNLKFVSKDFPSYLREEEEEHAWFSPAEMQGIR